MRRAWYHARLMRRSIVHIALVVRDYDEAIRYFTEILDFQLLEDIYQPEQDKRWVLVAPPGSTGTSLLLARASQPEQEPFIGNQAGGRVFLFLETDDFWRDYHALRRQGRGVPPPPRRTTLRHRGSVRGSLRQPLGLDPVPVPRPDRPGIRADSHPRSEC